MSDFTRYTPESLLDEIALVYDNLIIERSGDAWAYYELKTETYDMQALATKKENHATLTQILGQLPSTRAKIIITQQDFDRERYMAGLRSVNPTSREYRDWLPYVDNAIMATDRGARTKPYIAVRLHHDIFPPLRRAANGAWRETLAWFRQHIAGAITPVPDRDVLRAKKLADRVENLLRPLLAPPPVPGAPHPTPLQLARLIRHLYQRGIAHDDLPSIGTLFERYENSRVLVPNAQAWRALVADTTIKNKYSHLVLYHGNGTKTFQKFLGLSEMPTSGLAHPGDEYAYPRKVATDVLLDFDITPSWEAERKRQGKQQRLEAQLEHQQSAGGKIDAGMQEAQLAHSEMEAAYHSNMPRIGLHATYCVSADTLEKLNEDSEKLTDELASKRITASETRGAHIQAFADSIPVGPRRLKSYLVPMPPQTLAGSAPTASDHVGDDEGPLLGVTHRRQAPVFFNPRRAMIEGANSAVALLGEQGSGKSLTDYKFFAELCLAGFWQILIDPKGDAKNIAKLKELSGALYEVSIEPGAEVALPILKLYPFEEIDKTFRIVRDFLTQMFGALESQTELAEYKRDIVRMATGHFMERFENADGDLSIHRLKDSFRYYGEMEGAGKTAETANHMAHLLDTYSKNDLTSVPLSDEGDVFDATTGGGIATGTARSIIFYTHRLRLQSAEARAKGTPPTEEERIAQAVMSVVAAAAYEMAGKQRFYEEKIFRAVHVDELWQISSNSTGSALLDFLLRQARSQWVGSFLASQKWADVEDMKDHLGAVFLGRNPSEADTKAALSYMGVTPDKKTVRDVQGFRNGNFVFKDVDGRIAPIQVRHNPDRWRRSLDTTPTKKKGSSEIPEEPLGAA